MPKGNEDLKSKIAKLKGKSTDEKQLPPMPTPPKETAEEEDLEQLEKEFNERKQKILDKSKEKESQSMSAMDTSETNLDNALKEYADEGKFRVEVIFQLVKINNNLDRIATCFEGLVNNDE